MPKQVAVSACLLGENCRYDGKNKLDEELLRELKEAEVFPFCPEVELLGAPRETIDLVEGRALGKESGIDYTDALINKAKEFIKTHPKIDEIYFKSKSPSCALCSAREFDEKGNLISSSATGIFAKELKSWYKNAKIKERK